MRKSTILVIIASALCVLSVTLWARQRRMWSDRVGVAWASGPRAGGSRATWIYLESRPGAVQFTACSIVSQPFDLRRWPWPMRGANVRWLWESERWGLREFWSDRPTRAWWLGRAYLRIQSKTITSPFMPEDTTATERAAIVPHWLLVVATGSFPLWRFGRTVKGRLRRRRHGVNHPICAGCGYDLRATPERCPECGRQAVVAATIRTEPVSARVNGNV
jgi:hypothetical protein